MDFKQAFLEALQSNTALTKTISIEDYLPKSLVAPIAIKENLPFLQAYGNILCSYPYYYELSHLDSYCLLYSESGMGTLVYNNRNYVLAPDTLVFIDCREKHRIEIKQSQWNYKVFFINGKPIPFLHNMIVNNYGSLHNFPLGSAIPNMMQKFYTHLTKDSEKSFQQAKFILDILLEVVMEKNRLKEPVTHIPDYLVKIKHSFDINYQNFFSLDTLEQEYHISKYRICREFTEQYNTSPIQYLNHRRIEVAKEILVITDKRINEIGRIVGFENTNHLIRLFKKDTGVTPLVYRKQSPAFPIYN